MDAFKAYRIFDDEGKAHGRMTELALEDLDPGEVVVRASFSSVNYKDALAGTGAGKIARRFPLVGGIDVAGQVVSSDDPRFVNGDRVFVTGYGLSEDHDGGYSEFVRLSSDWIVPLPDGLSEWDAMALGTAGFTAALSVHQMERNGLRPESGPVAVTGATGGVGSIAVDILAGLGYEVVAITGKEEHDYLEHLGASQVLYRHDLEMGERPLEKAMWAGAVDSVGDGMLAWLTRTMRRHGNIASCGLAGGVEVNTTVMPFVLRGVNVLGVDSVYCPMDLRRELWRRLSSDMRPRHLEEIAHTVGFEELPQVLEGFLGGGNKGRTVVRISGG